MSAPEMTFSHLLEPITVEDFFETYYDAKPLHIKGNPAKAAGVCSWESFDELVNKTGIWSDRTFKMVIDTERVPAGKYCASAPGRDGMSVLAPVSRKVQKHLDNGASIVLDLVETLTPGIRSVTHALEMALAARATCNAYFSQNQRQAFPSHFDSTDVFALHIEGAKVWRVYTGRFEDPMERPGFDHTSFSPDYHEKAKGDLMMEVHMEPGDLLYLPKGWYHDALASSDACLHLSFGISQPSGVNFMTWLARGLDQFPAFRKPMPPHDDIAAYDAHVETLKKEFMQVMERPDVVGQFREDQKAKAFGGLCNVDISGAGPRFRVRGRGVKVVRRGQDFQVAAPGGKGTLPDGGDAVLDWVLRRDHFRQGELADAVPEIREQQRLSILQTLTSVGVLETL